MGNVIVILGLPGTGKTRLALALADVLARMNRPVLVAHTDVIKVTGRFVEARRPRDLFAELAWMNGALEAQAAKAVADGYSLVVEGTRAVGFEPPTGSGVFVLELDEAERLRQLEHKHESARAAVVGDTLTELRRRIAARRPQADSILDAARPIDSLVADCLAWLRARDA